MPTCSYRLSPLYEPNRLSVSWFLADDSRQRYGFCFDLELVSHCSNDVSTEGLGISAVGLGAETRLDHTIWNHHLAAIRLMLTTSPLYETSQTFSEVSGAVFKEKQSHGRSVLPISPGGQREHIFPERRANNAYETRLNASALTRTGTSAKGLFSPYRLSASSIAIVLPFT